MFHLNNTPPPHTHIHLFFQGLQEGIKILIRIVGMAVKELRDVVNGAAQMECVAVLDGLAMDVMGTWVTK